MKNPCCIYARLWFILALIFPFNPLTAQCPVTVGAGDDIFLCDPGMVSLKGNVTGNNLGYTWSPAIGLSSANLVSPTANVMETTIYTLTATAVSQHNLIVNGNFEAGNTGFSSGYTYSNCSLMAEGLYAILSQAYPCHIYWETCGDHTTGGGLMMLVNGGGTPNTEVWCNTVPVTPNTTYAFSCWAMSEELNDQAVLQFSINGVLIGPLFTPLDTCIWHQFYALWDSEDATTAEICILNQNLTVVGNDFTLDDISFAETCSVSDSVKVEIVNLEAFAHSALITLPCAGAAIALDGDSSSIGDFISYQWLTVDGNILSGDHSLNASVNAPGTYRLKVTFNNGIIVCEKTADVVVIEDPDVLSANIEVSNPLDCTHPQVSLNAVIFPANNGVQSMWIGQSGGNILSGFNSSVCTVNAEGVYLLNVIDTLTGCTAKDTFLLASDFNAPVVNASASDLNCLNTSILLSGSGSDVGSNLTAQWTTINGSIVSDANTLNHCRVNAKGIYTLTISNSLNGCSGFDTVNVEANLQTPLINIAQPDTLYCHQASVMLQAVVSGFSQNFDLKWISDNGSVIVGYQTPTPIVMAPGLYEVSAIDPENGCMSTATVEVLASTFEGFATLIDQPVCTNSLGSIEITGVQGDSPPFRYSFDGGVVFGENWMLDAVSPGFYELVVEDAYGCGRTKTVEVEPPFFPEIISPDTIFAKVGDKVPVQLIHTFPQNSIASVTWVPAEGLSCYDCLSPVILAVGSQSWVVTFEGTEGCTAQALVNIKVQQPEAESIYVPNAFAPNAYGDNTRFTIFSKPGTVLTIKTLEVFDRWGDLLFKREHFPPNDLHQGWDGSFRGVYMNPAVFVWVAEVEFVSGKTKLFKGDVALVW